MRLLLALAILSCIPCGTSAADELRKPDFRRGWRLHDDACTGCHGASMYSRPHHERNPYFTVRKQVELWQDFIGMGWGREEIDDVAYYVQKRFYDKTCAQADC